MKDEIVTVSLYLYSWILPPYIGYTTEAEPKTIKVLAFLKKKAVSNMLKDTTCFDKAVKAIWKKNKLRNKDSRKDKCQ